MFLQEDVGKALKMWPFKLKKKKNVAFVHIDTYKHSCCNGVYTHNKGWESTVQNTVQASGGSEVNWIQLINIVKGLKSNRATL